MASSGEQTTDQRRDSITSVISLWDKLPETHTIPVDIADDNDFLDEQDSAENDNEENFETSDDEIIPLKPLHRRFASSSNLTNLEEKNSLWTSSEYNRIKLIFHETLTTEAKTELQRRLASQKLQCISEDGEQLHSWNFGLSCMRFQLERSILIDIMGLTSVRPFPFWFRLKNMTEPRVRVSPSSDRIKPIRYGHMKLFHVSLRYGALTKLDEFHYSSNHSWTNESQNKWSLFINQDRADKSIDWIIEGCMVQKKKQLLLMNVDRTVVIHLLPDGFAMYICQKCNMNEFDTKCKTGNVVRRRQPLPSKPSRAAGMMRPTFSNDRSMRGTNDEPFKRISMSNGVYFATVQFTLRINSEHLKKEKAQNTVRQTLKLLIDFFTSHKITVCYGMINSRPGSMVDLFPTMNVDSLIMRYAWQMLVNIGYRFQVQMNEQFRTDLYLLSKEPYNADDLFYRVCVYLSRLFTLEPFVNLCHELHTAITESKRKREDSAFGLISSLDDSSETETYVPSVTLTPTTIRIKPLKLCRTNRVLRATQEFGKAIEHFVLVDIREENGQSLRSMYFQDLRQVFHNYLQNGFSLIDRDRCYKYLHHSQSQLRVGQFWFYHHEPGVNKAFDEAYAWMGNFDKDRNVAKYASRVALCFTTTTPTTIVNYKDVQEIRDIKTKDGKLTFTDGCGTISEQLRNDVSADRKRYVILDKFFAFRFKKQLGRSSFSAVQFRYAGAKGVVSVDPRLGSGYHLCIRDSMNKFTSEHRCFEVCKVSAPRSLYLNRQAILLLSHRKISDSVFLILQQRNHLSLIRNLLRNEDANYLLKEKLPYWFLPHDAQIDFVHEPFFRQILITACLISTRDLLRKTRIRVPRNKARNMFGIIDEYNVLKPTEVFVQYTPLHDLEDDNDIDNSSESRILRNCQVVITKNPCHHPGDVRTFTAVYHKALKHLKDVIVFSQQGDNPAPHQISGSDLDGDEYAVIWHEDLVPFQTPNDTPYDYDSQQDPKLLDCPVNRYHINDTVLNIAESDFLGRLSNLHLAYADEYGVDSNVRPTSDVLSTIKLAGAISEEVDSGKTGYHPLDEAKIAKQKKALGNRRPDFMESANMKSYPSNKILGKLYRSSRRTLPGWNRLLQKHRHLRHLQIRTPEDEEMDDEEEEEKNQQQIDADGNQQNHLPLDPSLLNTKPSNLDQEMSVIASQLFFVYRQEIREILNLYGLSHESDLWCRKSINSMGGELEDTAYTQLEQLVQRTRNAFYLRLLGFCSKDTNCCSADTPFDDLCDSCKEVHNRLAVALYRESYSGQNGSERAPILSLPWLFTTALLQTRERELPAVKGLLSIAMETALSELIERKKLKLGGLILTFRTLDNHSIEATVHWTVYVFVEILHYCLKSKSFTSWLKILSQFISETESFTPTLSSSQQYNETNLGTLVFKNNEEKDVYAGLLLSMEWTADDDELMHSHFIRLSEICFIHSRTASDIDNEYTRMSEEIILILQRIAIDKTPWSQNCRMMRS